MKIAVINSLYYPDRRGGAEVIAKEQAEKMQKQGNNVFIITTRRFFGLSSFFPRLEKAGTLRVYRFFPCNLFSFANINKMPWVLRLLWHFFDLFNFHSYSTIRKILKREKPDLVVTHNLKGIGYLTWLALRRLKIKNIQVLHDVQLVVPSGLLIYNQEKRVNNVFYKIYFSVCRLLVGSPDKIISPSKWLLDFYNNYGFFKNSQEKNIDLAFGKLPAVEKLELKPEKDKKVFTYLGQIEEHKGILFLIKTFLSLTQDNWQLQIIGTGSKILEAKKIIGDDTRFMVSGRLEGAERDKIVSKSDFVVVPSLCYENSPGVIPLSLSLGVPVIASRLGGIPEMIEEGVNGYLFEPADSTELLKIVEKIL